MAKRTWAVFWTWQQTKAVATKKEGMALARAWKARMEDKGWTVTATKGTWEGFNARHPDYTAADYNDFGPDSKIQTFLVVELTEAGKWIKPPYKPPPERKPVEQKPRRGRKPVGA